jgi:hypothetical protein
MKPFHVPQGAFPDGTYSTTDLRQAKSQGTHVACLEKANIYLQVCFAAH